jgi:hypothetical protein
MRTLKNFNPWLLLVFLTCSAVAQNPSINKTTTKKQQRKQKYNNIIRQEEEGILVYKKHFMFSGQLRTNGYGGFFEYGKVHTNRNTMVFRLDINETKDLKEAKEPNGGFLFGTPYIFGKQNYFYPATIGVGQQHILGVKGNKNGVSVSAVYYGGIALGMLRPYYLEVRDSVSSGSRVIKYSQADSASFLGSDIVGGGGFGKGWNEIKIKPGAFVKAALRFDYGRFNEIVSALEVGISAEFYSSKIPIMLQQKDKQLFFQAYIAVVVGKRK